MIARGFQLERNDSTWLVHRQATTTSRAAAPCAPLAGEHVGNFPADKAFVFAAEHLETYQAFNNAGVF